MPLPFHSTIYAPIHTRIHIRFSVFIRNLNRNMYVELCVCSFVVGECWIVWGLLQISYDINKGSKSAFCWPNFWLWCSFPFPWDGNLRNFNDFLKFEEFISFNSLRAISPKTPDCTKLIRIEAFQKMDIKIFGDETKLLHMLTYEETYEI